MGNTLRKPLVSSVVVLVLLASALTSTESLSAAQPASCAEVLRAVATDIDETLTTTDEEWLLSIFDPEHDAAERPSASEVFQAYADRGYRIVYVTARPDGVRLGRLGDTRNATVAWLQTHGFPTDPDRTFVYQAPDILSALFPRGYKAAAIKALEAQGFVFDFAYGNAKTDFEAFTDAGIPAEDVFSIGRLAGWGGTTGIPGGTYADHLTSHLPSVDPACDPGTIPPGPAACPSVAYDGLGAWLLEYIFGIPSRPHTLRCH